MSEISTQFGGGHEGKLRTFDPLISALFRPAGAESEKVTSFCLKRIKNKNMKNSGQIVKYKILEQGGKSFFRLITFLWEDFLFLQCQYFRNVKINITVITN